MEYAQDHTRLVKSLPCPPRRPLTADQFFKNGIMDDASIRKFLRKQGRILKQDFLLLVKIASSIFRNQQTLLVVDDPITIVGDIHGQYYDLNRILDNEVGGDPSTQKYLFLGDYVDRGAFSIQVLTLLLSMKIRSPRTILMLRGNHECRQLTSHFSFRAQCISKYDQQTYEIVMEMFDLLPLACLVNGKFLCLHGGISHELRTLNDIAKIDRFREIPKDGLFCDLVWADPVDHPFGVLPSPVIPNQTRGCSYYYGSELSNSFLNKNNLLSIIRAHEAQPDGFKMFKWKGNQNFPPVITLFSAPNYCDYYKNKGAVIRFQNNTMNISQFCQSVHPYILPNNLDLFSWSVPFIIEKVSEMLFHVIKPHLKYKHVDLPFDLMDKGKMLEKFIQDLKAKKQKNLSLTKLDGFCPDQRLLETGKFSAKFDGGFAQRRSIDLKNQSRPID